MNNLTTAPKTTNSVDLPKHSNGLTPLLRTFLDSRSLDKHRALVALELEALAKTYDRFGWDRDMGTPGQDKMIVNWMNALCDYPIDEVQEACARIIIDMPNKMPNQGHIIALIVKARGRILANQPPKEASEPEPTVRVTAEERAQILKEKDFRGVVEFNAKPFPKTGSASSNGRA